MKRGDVLKGLVVFAGLFLLSTSTAWAEPLRADTNCDGIVSTPDLDIFEEEYYLMTEGDPSTQCQNCETCGMIRCGDTCVDNSTDEGNCGTCGNICESGEICDNGTCVAIYPPAPVPKTGQTTCYMDNGTEIDCAGTGQDGDHQAGVPWPNPRFTDNGDGTVTDNLTGLIWLKNANCFGTRTWTQALSDCNGLESPSCGLSDNSTAGDWRLPNVKELQSLIDFEYYGPALPNTAGTGKWTEGDSFTGVQSSEYYWSSTTLADYPAIAWYVFMSHGAVVYISKTNSRYVWPVRGGND